VASVPTSKNDQRPIIIRRVKKVKASAHHGGAWKVAYADFVTAMMAFFMLLWLVANPDPEKLKGLAQYFSPSTASKTPGEAVETVPGEKPGLGGKTRRAQASNPTSNGKPSEEAKSPGDSSGGSAAVPDASMRVLAEELRVMLDPVSIPQSTDTSPAIEASNQGIRISLMDSANRSMFKGGTSTLNDYARNLLQRIGRKLIKSGVQISVEGHTDGAGGQADSNWRLSGDRALAARVALMEGGLSADRFTQVIALAATRPVYPDQPLRPENRRITVVLHAGGSALPSDVSFKF
jgi:chemotaxis protein MotB